MGLCVFQASFCSAIEVAAINLSCWPIFDRISLISIHLFLYREFLENYFSFKKISCSLHLKAS